MPTLSPGLLSLKQVRAIHALSEAGHIGHAAEGLNISQSAMSRSVQAAEELLGATLFQRGRSGAEPTSFGEILFIQCGNVLALLEQFERRELGNRDGHLRLPVRLRWSHLEAVASVIRTGSARAAGKDLGISQPAVSRSLSEITEIAGANLFTRRSHGLEPEPLAHGIAALWGNVWRELSAIPSLMERAAIGLVGRVAVGMLPFSDQDLVVRAFGLLTRSHPNLRLVAVPGSYHALTDALLRREIDVIMGLLRQPAPSTQLVERPLYSERFTLIARQDHPCHDLNATLNELSQFQWMVAPLGTPTRRFFERLFFASGTRPPAQTFEILSFANAEEMMANSQSIGLMNYSLPALERLRPDLRPVDFQLDDAIRPIGITMRKDEPVSPQVERFLEVLRTQIDARGLR